MWGPCVYSCYPPGQKLKILCLFELTLNKANRLYVTLLRCMLNQRIHTQIKKHQTNFQGENYFVPTHKDPTQNSEQGRTGLTIRVKGLIFRFLLANKDQSSWTATWSTAMVLIVINQK